MISLSPILDFLWAHSSKINGKGFYIYEKGSKPKPDFSVLSIIEESRRLTNIMPGGKPISVTDKEVVEMILFPIVNEACRVMDDGIVIRASDLDVASVLDMGFPSYRLASITNLWHVKVRCELFFSQSQIRISR